MDNLIMSYDMDLTDTLVIEILGGLYCLRHYENDTQMEHEDKFLTEEQGMEIRNLPTLEERVETLRTLLGGDHPEDIKYISDFVIDSIAATTDEAENPEDYLTNVDFL